MSDTQALVWAAILAPVVVLGVVAMVRGYHITLKVFRKHPERTPDDA